MAAEIQRKFDSLEGATQTSVFAWALLRLGEWHSEKRIVDCLGHALDVYRHHSEVKEDGTQWLPENPSGWILGVASRHLDADGLGKVQRWRDLHPIEKARPNGRSLNEESKPGKIVFDNDGVAWQHFGGTDWRPAP
jgi:hypothetical protein